MATLFFSRDGRDPSRAESKSELSIGTVMNFFQKHEYFHSFDLCASKVEAR